MHSKFAPLTLLYVVHLISACEHEGKSSLNATGRSQSGSCAIACYSLHLTSTPENPHLIAGEMLVGPKNVLFLDEISTGLDSSTTFLIVKCMRNVCHMTQVSKSTQDIEQSSMNLVSMYLLHLQLASEDQNNYLI